MLSFIQSFVDAEKRNGLIVLTRSHQVQLGQAVSQSLAGLTAVLTLLPFGMEELGIFTRVYEQFQEPTRAYRYYFQTNVERDLRSLLMVRDLAKFERFTWILADRVGQIFVASTLANELGLSYKTIQDWVALLEASYIIFFLRPYPSDYGKRFVKTPKLYFVEPGLTYYL